MAQEYISEEEFTKIKEQALIIDVRDRLEHQNFKSFPNSVNIPYEDLIAKPEKYITAKNQLIITYCNFGNRSGKAARFLRSRGYARAFVLNRGIYGASQQKIN